MPVNRSKIQNLIDRLKATLSLESISDQLAPKYGEAKPQLRHSKLLDQGSVEKHWEILRAHTALSETDQGLLADPLSLSHIET